MSDTRIRTLRSSSKRKRPAVLERDDYRCQRCGFGGRDKERALVIDHVIPISHGGNSKFPNLQTLCRNCDALKGDSTEAAE